MPKPLPCFTGTPLIYLGENQWHWVTTLDPSTPKIVAQDDKAISGCWLFVAGCLFLERSKASA